MKSRAVLLLSALAAGCATAPVPLPPDHLFVDHLFAASSDRISADDVFAISPEMKRYIATELIVQANIKGRQRALVDALYGMDQLKLEYDSAATRNAAQAFEARAGNCLSLVIMTSALAKELGLSVQYQLVLNDETWGRSGDIYLSIRHVNLTLSRDHSRHESVRPEPLTIDFIPPSDLRAPRTKALSEQTIIAMYMNNRAVETLAQGKMNDAYAWARAAIDRDPGFLNAYNTLGAVYYRHGNLKEAGQAYSYVLEREPENVRAIANLVANLNAQGLTAEAAELNRKLERLDPDPAFGNFTRGMAALRIGDYKAARDLFAKEVDRASYYHEFQYWLAVAYAGLGDVEHAREHLTLAMENSTTRKERDLYAAKLERIKTAHPQ
jgi:tetratricopeptide (TPR) repeat protein